MSDIPAGWYDDPEDPSLHRYWDGEGWTDHRAPRQPTGPRDGADSAWGIVSRSLALVGRHWREFVVIALPVLLLTVAGFVALWIGFDSALNVDTSDLIDRLSEPGFDPLDGGEDEAYVESLRFDVDADAILAWLIGGIALVFAGVVGPIAFSRFGAAARSGRRLSPGATYAGALGRLPRTIGLFIVVALAFTGAVVTLAVLAAFVPLTLLVTVPALFVGGVWAIVPIAASLSTISLAPAGTPGWATGTAIVKGRWWAYLGRLALVVAVVMALSLALGIVAGPIIAASIWGGAILNGVTQTALTVITQIGYNEIYLWADGPLDPTLAPTDSDSQSSS